MPNVYFVVDNQTPISIIVQLIETADHLARLRELGCITGR